METAHYDTGVLGREIAAYKRKESATLNRAVYHLVSKANIALSRPPSPVTDKPHAPASGDIHDYFSVAPYHWPPSKGGTRHKWRDGERIPQAQLFTPLATPYDRTRLQRLFDDTAVLTLAWLFTGNQRYAEHAAKVGRAFLISHETRMNPHLRFAQTLTGYPRGPGRWQGLIDLNGLPYFLDALIILGEAKAFDAQDRAALRCWFEELMEWLIDSNQGHKARDASNNLGTFYDLCVGSIANYLGDTSALYSALNSAATRLPLQVNPSGEQPEEKMRTLSRHYPLFSTLAWLSMLRLERRARTLNNATRAEAFRKVQLAASRILLDETTSSARCPTSTQTSEIVGLEIGLGNGLIENLYRSNPYLNRYSGLRPYWNLGLLPLAPHQFSS